MLSCPHNPLLPDDVYVPDAEAHVFGDRLYLYGSYDIGGRPGYCSGEYHVFSTSDMIHWVDHGVSFRLEQAVWYTGEHRALYAPDCVLKDGVYYLYYCVPDGRCGVARADRPEGPFEDVGPIEGVLGIDPAVLIDDGSHDGTQGENGKAYLYWGQFDGVRVAELEEDMCRIRPETVRQPLTVAEHDFHEGSSVKKINGKYVFLYTDTHRRKSDAHSYGMATCLGYAVSDHPTHGFTYGGVVIDNFGCDPGTWNNHGSLCQFRGQWYVFYHRSTHGHEFSRHVCAEPITIDPATGQIDEVVMTSSVGALAGGIPASEVIPASLTCGLTGHARLADPTGCGTLLLTGIRPGDTAAFRYLAFDGEDELTLTLTQSFDAPVRIHVLCGGQPVGEGVVRDGGGRVVLTSPLFGRQSLTLCFDGAFSDATLASLTFGCGEGRRG